jgi:hypothetical protein
MSFFYFSVCLCLLFIYLSFISLIGNKSSFFIFYWHNCGSLRPVWKLESLNFGGKRYLNNKKKKKKNIKKKKCNVQNIVFSPVYEYSETTNNHQVYNSISHSFHQSYIVLTPGGQNFPFFSFLISHSKRRKKMQKPLSAQILPK